ncbi:hypothetical protein [Methyloferula stellata]|uniref:hypothetical protein n=1 Tax=Methyloferula stellata TaxID=876270 RepID=UPI00037917B6|nr:hypothetical protein [Methyloferula stellata]
MQTSTDKTAVRSGLRVLAFAGLASILAIGVASAQQAYPRASRYYSYYDQGPGFASSRADRADFDRSGTRGRLGLGASPYHPEGPGNPSN